MALSKIITFWDYFNRVEYGRWNNWDASRQVINGQLNVTVTNAYPAIQSKYQYDLTGSSICLQIVQVPNVGNGSTQAFFNVSLDANTQFGFTWHNNQLKFETKVGGTTTTQAILTYNATSHKWWRFREDSGTMYWETSADAVTWNSSYSMAYTPTPAPAAVTVGIGAGYYGTEPAPGTAIFDNVNRPLGQRSVPKPDTGWSVGAVTKGMVPAGAVVFEESWPGSAVNTANWDIITWAPGTVNNELQQYAASALTVANNQLRIRATNTGGNWTSGRIHLNGGKVVQYGYVEARIKFPSYVGVWPSFWLLGNPSSGWPGVGEFDMVEVVGTTGLHFTTMHGALADGTTHFEQRVCEPVYDPTQWHTYGVDLRAGRVTVYLDGVVIGSLTPAEIPGNGQWPFDSNSYFIVLNFAIGGDFPSPPDGTTPATMDMLVGRVRIYA